MKLLFGRPVGVLATPAEHAGVLVAVVFLLALHPLASSLFLPALPQLREQSGAAPATVQWTLSAFVLGFGATQILWGALSDRLGRRPTLLIGLSAYLVAAAGCLAAGDVAQLVLWRALEGAGVAAAGVTARAMLRDLHDPVECARLLSIGFSWLGVIGLAAPLTGAVLVDAGGVPLVLGAVAAFGAVVLVFVALTLPETRSVDTSAGDVALDFSGWLRIGAHPVFRAYTALTTCTYVGHYVFLVGSSSLLVDRYGLSTFSYGLVLSFGSVVHMLGTVACRRWLAAGGIQRTVAWAGRISLASGVALIVLASFGVREAWAVVVPQCFYIFAHAVHQSCGQAAVMGPFRASAGTAAALQGTLLPLSAVAVATLLAKPLAQSAVALPASLGACALLTAAVAFLWVQQLGTADVDRVRSGSPLETGPR